MLNQLLFSNIHFGIQIFAGLVFFFFAWLHLDSWKVDKRGHLLLNFLGFLTLSFSYLLFAVNIKTPEPGIWVQAVKILALLIIIAALLTTPGTKAEILGKAALAIPLTLISYAMTPLVATLYLIIALIYLKQVKTDMRKQTGPLIWAFAFLGLSEGVNIIFFMSGTQVVSLSQMLANYGLFWWLSRLLELIGLLIMAKWTWGYIRFRAGVQIFAVLTTSALTIFLATTFTFTALLLRNLRSDVLKHLETDVKVLQLNIDSLAAKALADSRSISLDSRTVTGIGQNDTTALNNLLGETLSQQDSSYIQIVNPDATLISNASTIEEASSQVIGASLIDAALQGEQVSDLITQPGVLVNNLKLQASVPVIEQATASGEILGAVSVGFDIDSAFVDGIKKVTGLETTVYVGDAISSTTITAPGGTTRISGTKVGDEKVTGTVLGEGNNFIGDVRIFNQPYYAVFTPFKNRDSEIIGMYSIGEKQSQLLITAENSISLSFIGSAILIILSVIPAYFAANYIREHVNA